MGGMSNILTKDNSIVFSDGYQRGVPFEKKGSIEAHSPMKALVRTSTRTEVPPHKPSMDESDEDNEDDSQGEVHESDLAGFEEWLSKWTQ